MKHLILTLLIISGSFASAQKMAGVHVPAAVTSKFVSLYPDSKAEKWKKQKKYYEANFIHNSKKSFIVIDSTGNVVRTRYAITISELPVAVDTYVTKNYANQKITEASKTTEADGKVKYEAKVKKTSLCFDSEGGFIKSEKCKK